MLISSFKSSSCLNGCTLFNDEAPYLYWESRIVTDDEFEIVKYINDNFSSNNINIFHIGIGNSYLASNIKKYKKIDGISISTNELNFAKKLNIKNYNVFFLNKLSRNVFAENNFSNYDVIIDANLKSFSCCENAFNDLFSSYTSMLNENGKIITGKKGMNWSRIVKPVLNFSIKKLFYKRLKEFDGPNSNILKIDDCVDLSKKHNLKLCYNESSNIVYFVKIT